MIIEELAETLKYSQRGSPAHILVLKKQYECEMKMGRAKDGEVILRNIIEMMADPAREFQTKEVVSSKFDLVLHELNYSIESNPQKLVDKVRTLIRSKDF